MSNDLFLTCFGLLAGFLVAVELRAMGERREHMKALDKYIASNEEHARALQRHAQSAEIYKTSVEALIELRKATE